MENTARTVTIERSEYESMRAEIAEIRTLLEWYKSRLLSVKRHRFGSSSEKSDADLRQFSLFGEEETAPPPEREIADLSPEERLKKRLEKGKPFSDAFFAWAKGLGALPKTPLGIAVGYTLSQRPYLENIYLDGRTEISNNRCERAVKPFVIGRKAWLFSNTPTGAKASSVMYSITETAKENGLHPFRYMEFLLETLPNATTADLESLLPWSETLPDRCKTPGESEHPCRP
jgi:hypothetical protein